MDGTNSVQVALMTRHLVAWYTCDVMIAVNVSAMNVRSGGGGGAAAAAGRAILAVQVRRITNE